MQHEVCGCKIFGGACEKKEAWKGSVKQAWTFEKKSAAVAVPAKEVDLQKDVAMKDEKEEGEELCETMTESTKWVEIYSSVLVEGSILMYSSVLHENHPLILNAVQEVLDALYGDEAGNKEGGGVDDGDVDANANANGEDRARKRYES